MAHYQNSAPIREHRIKAFCDWLETIPPSPPFHTHPAFRFYADLTDAEIMAASNEMRRRGEALRAEAEALRNEGRKR